MELVHEEPKLEFDIPVMFRLLRKAIQPYPPAMLFALRDQGFDSSFQILVACIISIRTFDEVSLGAAQRLLTQASTPQAILQMSDAQLRKLIEPCTFAPQKVQTLKKISLIALDKYQGKLPCDYEALIDLPGVGPKCANLTLGVACHQPHIGVDIHVHRITNRWGYVHAKTPEKTLHELEKILPKSRWVEINELLVPFGKHICLGVKPKCTQCPVRKYCRRIGVTQYQ